MTNLLSGNIQAAMLIFLVTIFLVPPGLAQTTTKSDTLRALVVFAIMQDDRSTGDPKVFHRGWPLQANRNRLPSFARDLLSTSPTPPFPETSLTAYFYEQSLGQFVLFGEVYDSVLVSNHPEARYHRPQGGYGDLTQEILQKLDRYGTDFSRYDYNNDGKLDHLFIVLRSDSKRDDKSFVWTGASCLDGRCAGGLVSGKRSAAPVYDGVTIDWNSSGSYIMHRTPGNIIPHMYHVRLMAHEIGHDLWEDHFVHIPALTRNDIPRSSNRGKTCIGYVLMAGSGGGRDCGGNHTISAYERDLLGWINCRTPTTAQYIQLGDLYTTNACLKIPLDTKPMGRRLYLSNLQRVGPFSEEQNGGNRNQFEMGLLRTEGVLVHLADRHQLDVLAADNSMDVAITNTPYDGDLFGGPDASRQLTPWTRPNSNGFNIYPPTYQPTWIGFDDFKRERGSVMGFQYYPDFREAPVIREDSWMGRETRDSNFRATVEVRNDATLDINTTITLSGGMTIRRGSTVRIAPQGVILLPEGAILRIERGATLLIEGTLHQQGQLNASRRSRIRQLPTGTWIKGSE